MTGSDGLQDTQGFQFHKISVKVYLGITAVIGQLFNLMGFKEDLKPLPKILRVHVSVFAEYTDFEERMFASHIVCLNDLAESKDCEPIICINKWDLAQAEELGRKYPSVESVMIGRGLIGDPGMLAAGTDVKALKGFMDELMAVYTVEFGGSRNAIFRLKGNWGFLHNRFEGCDKLWKRLRKTTDLQEYKSITAEIFQTLPLK